ncbi:MFS transporter [Alicyclobacillus sp. TC]|uniref:MFS transporter n=1 Tax=Alicyclobacillus sp. TC TaxID=2606450 RepID=UPI001AF5D7A3|nr:MFS transporter [Alicyclobacillus sp. TC]QRF23875.1 MFS transporter [Alicyclobacillus sp. TC]
MLPYVRLFRQRNFAYMTIADAVSVLGDQIGWVALLWFAMVTTNHAGYLGLLGLAFGLPGVLLGAVVGNVLDGTSHKTVLVTANMLLAIVFMAIPLLYQVHALPMVVMFGLVLTAGCLTPFTSAGWMVVIPNLVKEDELGPANSIVETIWNGASLLGPLLAGLLIARFGATVSIFADGVSFLVAALCVFLVNEPKQHSEKPSQRISFFHDTWDGIKMLYGLKAVWWITLGAVGFLLAYGQLEVSLPLFTHNELASSAAILGSIWSTYFVGSLVGSAFSGLTSKGNRSGVIMAFMVIGWGLSFVPMLWFHSLWVTFICVALAGLLFGGYPPLARTVVQRLVPKEFLGRILGIRGSIIALGAPVGSYLGGTFGQWFPSSMVIGATGFVVVVIGLMLLSLRSFRTI